MTLIALLIALIILLVLILPWLGARLFLAGPNLAQFDNDTGEHFGKGRPEHPNVTAAMARLAPSNAAPPGLTRKQRIAFKRDKFDHMFDDLAFDAAFTPVDSNGVHGEWVTAPGCDPSRRMLYLHGGGFVVGSPRSHRPLTARMAAATGGAVLALDYRLLPEHKRTDGIADARQAYRWLLGHGPGGADGKDAAATVFVAGDSAGANLALSLLAWIRSEGLQAPAAAVAISPPTDATWSSPSIRSNLATDYMLGPAIKTITRLPHTLTLWASWITSGIRPCDPLISPVHGDLAGLPPLLVHVSATEMLYDDARRYVNKARAAGSPAMLQSWNNTLHVWHMFPELPESAEALAEIARFIARVAPHHKVSA